MNAHQEMRLKAVVTILRRISRGRAAGPEARDRHALVWQGLGAHYPGRRPNGGLRLGTARYYTPSGRSIQAKGIDPDIVVEEELPDDLRPKLVADTTFGERSPARTPQEPH